MPYDTGTREGSARAAQPPFRAYIMTNTEKLHTAFAQALQIDPAQVTDNLTYNEIPQWDSVAHMALVAELESAFDIMLDTDDILAMSTVAKAREILQKYDVAF